MSLQATGCVSYAEESWTPASARSPRKLRDRLVTGDGVSCWQTFKGGKEMTRVQAILLLALTAIGMLAVLGAAGAPYMIP